MIIKHLQQCAKKVYNIKCKKALAKWSTQSIRIGACISLSEAVKDAPFIQTRLRWRFLAFRDYLRNIVTLAHQNNEVYNKKIEE